MRETHYMRSKIVQAVICHNCDDYDLQLMKIHYLGLLHAINKKKDCTWNNIGPLKSINMHMYSVLGLGPFCSNYCLNWCGMEAISQWHC